jgi:hypothetical protein
MRPVTPGKGIVFSNDCAWPSPGAPDSMTTMHARRAILFVIKICPFRFPANGRRRRSAPAVAD